MAGVVTEAEFDHRCISQKLRGDHVSTYEGIDYVPRQRLG